ncbi:hypothetical protein [Clostridium tyrobutyricum]|uniref:hypothetical protein n=1 Tax=Clostridium tyrobutyricum TaxID=1519 RepID=UPI001C382064|nr:hypothetical protein [Clostridium tyrobutyricum]MBV4415549.1 hypothetical protein [Clostridium tyrobutyricum]MBV4421370.1 hypothetical protein [Clostridium tyrobutyricum]
MDTNKKRFLKNICKYCVSNYMVSNSSPIMSSLIYHICKFLDMDSMAVQGIVTLHINEFSSKSFAHCFNVCDGIIIDASIYEYALINRRISHIIPMYIVDSIPYNISYTVQNEIPIDYRFKFSNKFVNNIINEIKFVDDIYLGKFNLIDDAKKKNLFYCR